jgi:hypothetical protein
MSVIETLTQRNEAFASSRFSADLKIVPSMKTMIIGCVDPRVDPVDMFGLAPGEAAVIRNVGGRSPRQRSRQAMLRIVATARSHQQWFRPAFGPQENSAPHSGQSSRAPARQDVGKVNLPESVPTAAPIAQFRDESGARAVPRHLRRAGRSLATTRRFPSTKCGRNPRLCVLARLRRRQVQPFPAPNGRNSNTDQSIRGRERADGAAFFSSVQSHSASARWRRH